MSVCKEGKRIPVGLLVAGLIFQWIFQLFRGLAVELLGSVCWYLVTAWSAARSEPSACPTKVQKLRLQNQKILCCCCMKPALDLLNPMFLLTGLRKSHRARTRARCPADAVTPLPILSSSFRLQNELPLRD